VTALAPAALEPLRWLGGPSKFGLLLPDASPTPSTMYAPRGVCLTPEAVLVADTGNHRVVIWNEAVPGQDHQDADVVIGQPDMASEGPKLFFLPTGLLVDRGRLVVADAWHHRILAWDDLVTAGSRPPSLVLGQDDLDGVDEGCGPQRFYWPFGVAVVDGAVFVADAGNHRVLAWREPSGGGPEADVVLGQPDPASSFESPYRVQDPASFRFPYAVASSGDGALFVADTSNNRVGVYDDAVTTFASCPWGALMDRVLGQDDLLPTARTVGSRSSRTACAGCTGCRGRRAGWAWPTRATTG